MSMGAILGGTMRAPFTSIVFAFELTHDANVFVPLLVGSVIAHAFTVLTLKRSILTEKVARPLHSASSASRQQCLPSLPLAPQPSYAGKSIAPHQGAA
jgi:H+/Cl- antiporter ClcA